MPPPPPSPPSPTPLRPSLGNAEPGTTGFAGSTPGFGAMASPVGYGGGPAAPAARGGLAKQRCAFHASREAVARCPECRRFFCRECVTEHDDRLLCASCLRKTASSEDAAAKPSAALGYIRSAIAVSLGFGVAWSFFAILLLLLASLPTNLDFTDFLRDSGRGSHSHRISTSPEGGDQELDDKGN